MISIFFVISLPFCEMIMSVLRAIYNIFVSDSSHMQRTLLKCSIEPRPDSINSRESRHSNPSPTARVQKSGKATAPRLSVTEFDQFSLSVVTA